MKIALLAALLPLLNGMGETQCWLDELELTTMTSGWGRPRANRSVEGNPLTIDGQHFKRGVGTHAESWFVLQADGQALGFEAMVGIDDETGGRGNGSVVFRVYADQRVVAETKQARATQRAKSIKADLTGAKLVILHVSDGGDGISYDHANWCDARFTLRDGAVLTPTDKQLTRQMGVLTPAAPETPRINGARIFGVRPNKPVLFTIPATGVRPIKFSAENLPPGLTLDSATGRFTGSVRQPGTYKIALSAQNAEGKDQREWRLVVGETIALTPPMGWNSWNCFAGAVTAAHIRQAADAMIKSGLADHGWSYINIDDFWQTNPEAQDDPSLQGAARSADGTILPNKRFPNMRELADYVHNLGLKIGLYSSPGPTTCGGCIGSWQHEAQDARTYAEWGFDYLKYDLCSYPSVGDISNLKGIMRPYLLMDKHLRAQNRDIIHSICQYGLANVSAWGAKAGQSWRTTYDITDTWESMTGILDAQDGLELFAAPGSWNDPDMLIVGMVGWGDLHPTRLTPNQQYTHVSLWCLLCSPLLIGCDMTQLDDFTLSLLTNDEVIEVNQDPLGQQAARVEKSETQEVWAKKMEDGSTVVGVINRSFMTSTLTIDFKALGLQGRQRVRDLWRQRDEGTFEASYQAEVFGHGTQLVRLFQE
ncbi:MAG: NPCBM/NEW2 domain-containing protein [Kiritimatiellae bacterium]|nr:NPCBM/NEW2 domain-containing protein [Kiritimatiellia bacterium]